jgi:hypothetical protein
MIRDIGLLFRGFGIRFDRPRFIDTLFLPDNLQFLLPVASVLSAAQLLLLFGFDLEIGERSTTLISYHHQATPYPIASYGGKEAALIFNSVSGVGEPW